MSTDFLKLIFTDLENQGHEFAFGIKMTKETWLSFIFDDVEKKKLNKNITFEKNNGPLMRRDLALHEREPEEWVDDWIGLILYKGFKFATVCCRKYWVLQPKTLTTAGIKRLDEFRATMEDQGGAFERLKLVSKKCGCT
jgi:hypothetical protein